MSYFTYLITGASSGFGAAIAETLAAPGRTLVLIARRLERLQSVARACEERGATVHCRSVDVRLASSGPDLIHEMASMGIQFDVLINNAGLALGLEPAHRADLQDWDTMIATNISAVCHLTRAVLPGMVERNCGHIVMIGSTAGSWPYPGGNVYGGTKAFIDQFTRNLRCDLLGTSLRITSIAPGMAETEFSTVRFKGDAGQAAAVYRGTEPLRAVDIADTVRYVLDAPPHVNINHIELMSIDQAWGPFAISRRSDG